ncbi:NAD(P)/FAD-dependent oxidoreductase [Acidocella sp.]|uniref:NAD(P)/FAD-dependent oxidoreductase n=1 Tax=Acidocella sp. TaxID=50710 RepID=UPI003D04C2DE
MIEAMMDVAIVGGGPSGIAAALRLKARGVPRVTILEREEILGGVPRHCAHPPFGMREFGRVLSGPAYARRLAEAARAAGVEILPRHGVVALKPDGRLEVALPDGRREIQARRVLLATGAREMSRAARLVGGARPIGVLNTGALQAYVNMQGLVPFRRPVVVGTELVALSALSTCRHHGIRPVAMVEENARPTARWPLSLYPKLARVPLHLNTTIERIDGMPRVERVVLSTGQSLACDGVLFTGRFLPEASLVQSSHLSFDPGTRGPVVDQYGRCSDTAYFAAGNVLRPVETAGWSFREGVTIGDYIADDLSGGLPSLEGSLDVSAGENVKFVMPQRLAHVAPLRGRLQLRVAASVQGQLRVRAGEAVLYRRRVDALPERRILINLDGVKTPPDDARLVVEIIK